MKMKAYLLLSIFHIICNALHKILFMMAKVHGAASESGWKNSMPQEPLRNPTF